MRFPAKITSSCIGLPYLLIELFYIGMSVAQTDSHSGGWSVGVRSRDYQIFSDG